MRLGGRCALVTGAASGLGRATAEILHSGGATVVLADLDLESLGDVARSLGRRALPFVVDVRDSASVEAAIAFARQQLGAVHIVVNCAGIASSAKIVAKGEPHDLDLFQRVVDVNLTGTFNVLRLAAAQMLRNEPDEQTGERGVIVNTASIAACDGQRGQAAYAASKAGVIGLSLPVARDLAEHAIRCVAISPGVFDTAMLDSIPEVGLRSLNRSLLYPNRPGQPAEFAAFVQHVIENPYLNGTCVRLDGGSRLCT